MRMEQGTGKKGRDWHPFAITLPQGKNLSWTHTSGGTQLHSISRRMFNSELTFVKQIYVLPPRRRYWDLNAGSLLYEWHFLFFVDFYFLCAAYSDHWGYQIFRQTAPKKYHSLVGQRPAAPFSSRCWEMHGCQPDKRYGFPGSPFLGFFPPHHPANCSHHRSCH